jgi:hypothetical protein
MVVVRYPLYSTSVFVQYSNLTGDKKYLDEMHKYYMERTICF